MRYSPKLVSSVLEALENRVLFSESGLSIVPHVDTDATPQVSAVAAAVTTGITSEYFAGDDLQTPVSVNTDANINFDWKYGKPVAALPAGAFSAKWTGEITPKTTSVYTFYTRADSGTRVIVNGTTVLDNFSARTASVTSGSIALTAGVGVSIEVDYASRGTGSAYVQLLWSSPTSAKHLVPQSVLTPAVVSLPSEPLTATYYLGGNFNQKVVTETQSAVHFNLKPTVPDALIPDGDSFSTVYNGTVTAPVTGTYVFKTITDDGVRLFVDGTEIINHWKDESHTTYFTKMALTAGQSYTIKMDYYDNGIGAGIAKLLWTVPGATASAYVPFSLPAPVTPPAAPANVTATPISSSAVDLTWSDVTGESGFIIERSSDGGATFSQIGTTPQGVTMFDDTGLTSGTPYEYEVIAVNTAGDSAGSAVSATTLPGVPAAPVASATVSGATATINWTASPGAISYLVEKSLTGTSAWTTVGTTSALTLQDTAVAAGTTDYYRVTASNTSGAGTPSNVVSVTPVTTAPTNLAASVASQSEIDLTWTGVTGATSYTIEKSTNGTSGFTAVGTTAAGTNALAVGGLTAATPYFFQVLANNAAGASAGSNIATATTGTAVPSYANLTMLYGLTGNGTVYSISTSTGAAAQIGTLLFGTNAAGRDPLTGNFFYVSTGSSTVEVASWNPNNGVNTVINASVPLGNPVAQAAFRDDGVGFLTTDIGQLFTINNNTAVASEIGVIKANGNVLDTGTGDIAFAPNDTLYIETNSELYSMSNSIINGGTGSSSVLTATDIGPTNTTNLQIAFGQNGVLFGTNAAGQLYTLNTTTGAGTAVGTASGVDMGDLASVPLYGNLSVAQTASTLVRGTTGTYSVTVSNAGPDSTVGPITLVDTLAAGVTFASGTGTGWTFSVSGSTVTMTYTPNVTAGASAPVVTLNVNVGSTAANSVSNSILASTTEFETNTANNMNTISSPVTG